MPVHAETTMMYEAAKMYLQGVKNAALAIEGLELIVNQASTVDGQKTAIEGILRSYNAQWDVATSCFRKRVAV